jgi:dTDP-4-dehydrorhamnose 3,5-epimerase
MSQFSVQSLFGGAYMIHPNVHSDKRGQFHETFNIKSLMNSPLSPQLKPIQQINHSTSIAGTLRGMHFQKAHPQAKIVMVTRGAVIDFIQDIRPESPTYGQSTWALLDDTNYNILYVPRGFSHGFIAIRDSDFVYFCDDIRYAGDEYGFNANSLIEKYKSEWKEILDFDVETIKLIVSDKDKSLPEFGIY